jgi:hypothetical protein
MFSTLRNRALLKLYVTILVFSTIGFMSQSVNIPYILGLGGGVLEVNLITTIQTSIGMILLVPFGMLSNRLVRKPMLLRARYSEGLVPAIEQRSDPRKRIYWERRHQFEESSLACS